MQTHTKYFFAFSTLCLATWSIAQTYDLKTGVFGPVQTNNAGAVVPAVLNESEVGLNCQQGKFYATDMNGNVKEFTLYATYVSAGTSLVSGSNGGASLGVSNNLNGGAYSPTFYNSTYINLLYYSGSTWQAIPNSYPYPVFNAAGSGNYLYYTSADTLINIYNNTIVRYNGSAFSTIYQTDSSRYLAVADLGVDSAGNIWVPVGSIVPPMSCDSILVISPTGQVIDWYPFNMNTQHAYGAFLMNGTFYIGLGNSNPSYPDKLIPVSFSAGIASIGSPISFAGGYSDLASCVQTAVGMEENEVLNFSVFPNPSSDKIFIKTEQSSITCTIFDIQGVQVASRIFSQEEEKSLELGHLSEGMYIIELKSNSSVGRQRIVRIK